jgi:hypothetical protein
MQHYVMLCLCPSTHFTCGQEGKGQNACSAFCPETGHQPESVRGRLNLLLGINQVINH